MRQKRLSERVVAAWVLAWVGFQVPLFAQESAKFDPLSVLPPDATAYSHFVGYDALKAKIDGTAAYLAIVDSGLAEALRPAIDHAIREALKGSPLPEENKVLFQHGSELALHLLEKGVTVGGYANLALGELAVVVPKAKEDGFAEKLDKFAREQAAKQNQSIRDQTLEGRKVATLNARPVFVSWWTEPSGDLVLFGNTLGPNPAIRRVVGKEGRFATSEKAKWTLPSSAANVAVRKYVDLAGLVGLIPRFPPVGAAVSASGIETLQSFRYEVGVDGNKILANYQIGIESPRKGFLRALEGASLKLDDLPELPADVTSVFAFAVNPTHTFDVIHSTVQDIIKAVGQPEPNEDWQDEFAKQSGFRMKEELFDPLGDVILVYHTPSEGHPQYGDVVYALGVKNQEVMEQTMEIIAEKMVSESRGEVTVERKKLEDASLWVFNAEEVPFRPCIALTEDWLAIGMFGEKQVERFIQLQDDDDAWEVPEELARIAGDHELVSVAFVDPRPLIKMLYQFEPVLRQSLKEVAPDLSIGLLPDVDKVTGPLFPCVSIAYLDDQGLHGQSESSLPLFMAGTAELLGLQGVNLPLVLPAAMSARSAARRAQEMNNLKQLGLACHNYHDAFNGFPQGTVEQGAKLEVEKRLSWLASTLPFIEQSSAYDGLALEEAWDSPKNAKVTSERIEVFISPLLEGMGPKNATHVVGMAGVGKDAATLKATDPKAGILGYDRKTRLRDITDGTSKTIMSMSLGEDFGPWGQGGRATIRGLTEEPYIGGPDGFGGVPNVGAIALFADGSVRVISESIDPGVLEGMSTMAGGEVVNP